MILIKLADRLHNMRTLDYVRPSKQRRIASETLEIYAPIANRLGLNALYRELQELSFMHKYPMRYRVLAKAIRAARGNRREVVSKGARGDRGAAAAVGHRGRDPGREKHLYGIYRKMLEKNLSSQVLDIYGFRVIVKDTATCYLALGRCTASTSRCRENSGLHRDPQGERLPVLHTTLIGPFGTPVEVQVRTHEMHHIAETGVASHWLYKEDEKTLRVAAQDHLVAAVAARAAERKRRLGGVSGARKDRPFPARCTCSRPRARSSMPRGSTSVDFAYAVHTDVGNRCVACRINAELMPLRTELRNGDQVEIITAAHVSPNPAWLSHVRTGKARGRRSATS